MSNCSPTLFDDFESLLLPSRSVLDTSENSKLINELGEEILIERDSIGAAILGNHTGLNGESVCDQVALDHYEADCLHQMAAEIGYLRSCEHEGDLQLVSISATSRSGTHN